MIYTTYFAKLSFKEQVTDALKVDKVVYDLEEMVRK